MNGPAYMNAMPAWVRDPRGLLAGQGRGPVVIEVNMIVKGFVD